MSPSKIKNHKQHKLASQYRKPTGSQGKLMGRIFEKTNKDQNDWVISLLNIHPSDHILEIGFGNGSSIKKVARAANKGFVAGVDHSKIMVKEAKERNAKTIKSGLIKLQFGDVYNLPFPNNSFDKIFAVYVIYFWEKPLDALKEIYRVLKSRGVVAIYLSTQNTLKNIPFAQTGIFNSYSPKELTKIFSQAGFKSITYKIKKIDIKIFNKSVGFCMLAKKII